VWRGHKYLAVVYQIDQGLRRLLWVGRERTEDSFRGFFQTFGEARAKTLRFVASDMWEPSLESDSATLRPKLRHRARDR
jgi:transposase